MRTRIAPVILAVAAFLSVTTLASVAATPLTSSPNGLVNWKTAADVVRGLKAHGFACKKDGSTPHLTWGLDLDGNPTRAIAQVGCDGYTVILVKDPAATHALEKAQCKAATAEDWARFRKSVGLTGKNFYIISSADDHSFPARARPVDFQKAFGGIIETDAQYLARMFGCRQR